MRGLLNRLRNEILEDQDQLQDKDKSKREQVLV